MSIDELANAGGDVAAQTRQIIERLLAGEAESECVEFKHNNYNPQEIGEYLSALSNSAALHGESKAFMLWGVEDGTHRVLGTTFKPATTKQGSEGLENWLTRQLTPALHFEFRSAEFDGKPMVLLVIDPASVSPTSFSGQRYIRVGSHKKPLAKHPERETRLFAALNAAQFEMMYARTNLSATQAIALLDYPQFFHLTETALPNGPDEILETLRGQGIVTYTVENGWSITNLGALLLARKLDDFPTIARKALRVVRYAGTSKMTTDREVVMPNGYAAGFDAIISTIMTLAPHREVIEGALRRNLGFPEIAVRELVANAMIHQDFAVRGASPMVEIYDDRIEISNPGEPLVPTDRLVNAFPQSRNERIAGLMKLCKICEERGTGWDKVASEVSMHLLPAPVVESHSGGTHVVLLGPRPLNQMSRTDRVRAIYLHACLLYQLREPMANATVRSRFGLDDKDNVLASRWIKEAVESGRIAVVDPDAGTKSMRYVPAWALAPVAKT